MLSTLLPPTWLAEFWVLFSERTAQSVIGIEGVAVYGLRSIQCTILREEARDSAGRLIGVEPAISYLWKCPQEILELPVLDVVRESPDDD